MSRKRKDTASEDGRKRFTITLPVNIHAAGKAIGKQEGRDFSHQIEAMIKEEHARMFPTAKAS